MFPLFLFSFMKEKLHMQVRKLTSCATATKFEVYVRFSDSTEEAYCLLLHPSLLCSGKQAKTQHLSLINRKMNYL